jgi:phosphatidate cytidylyltransferase
VTGIHPANNTGRRASAGAVRSNLALRVASSLVMAPLAIASAYAGGAVFLAFWTIAALVVLWEWQQLIGIRDRNPNAAIGAVALVGCAVSLGFGYLPAAVVLLTLGMLGTAILASKAQRTWRIAGLLYAAVLIFAPVVLRQDVPWGFCAILFLFVIVWLTDMAAYFAGRALGGPKLMPRISPNKTWSGAIAGALAGVGGGLGVALAFGIENLVAVAIIGLGFSVVAQGGDLVESAVKRVFDVKDAGGIIPGHGGLMDRLDGFLAAAAAAALIGLMRGGIDTPAQGLMIW